MINMEINLSKRLLSILENIDLCLGDFLDIGSDHGLLPISLYYKNYPFKIYASENKKGPFNILSKSIESYSLKDKITPLYGDGLDVYKKGIKQVSISGMGGLNIINIISNGLKNKDLDIQMFILEPQKDTSKVRKYLESIKYKCIKEFYIEEKEKIYPIMIYIKGEEIIDNELYYEYGKLPLINKDKVLINYLNKSKLRYNQILLESNNIEIKNKLESIDEALKVCSM